MWQELYDSLRIVLFPDHPPLPKPLPAALDEYEAMTNFRLPPSYRGYALVFGPGELGAYARIRTPGYKGTEFADLFECDRFTHEGDWLLCKIYGQTERIRRLVYFATSFTGDIFGWDAAEVTDPVAPEYAIWGLPRHREHLIRVANTFQEFVRGVLEGTVAETMEYEFGMTAEERREFIPSVKLPDNSADSERKPG
jgi:hypothetical protein